MKLHATLIIKKRLLELGWEVDLRHQDECPEHSHWFINTNIPYRSYSWPVYHGGVIIEWSYGTEYETWKQNFYKRNDFRRFLKRYYKHHVNFWDWDALEAAIVYEDTHIYKALHRPFPTRR